MDNINLSTGIIDFLRSKPFVHIISEPRTGSSALYNHLVDDDHIDLSEPFSNYTDKDTSNDSNTIITYLENNIEKCRAMKNHAMDFNILDQDQCNRIFALPSFTVLLTRNNWFEQTCSLALACVSQSWDKPYDGKVEISLELFKQSLYDIMESKQQSAKYIKKADLLLSYENIIFKNNLMKQNEKTNNIINLIMLSESYQIA